MFARDAEHIGDRRVDVDVGRQRLRTPRLDAGPRDHQRRVAERFVVRHAGFAEDVFFAEVMAVIGAQDDRGVGPQVLRVDDVEQTPEPVIDHPEFCAVVRADVVRFARRDDAAFDGADRVRRPDDLLAAPIGIVTIRPRRRRIERLVWIEFVDEQQEAIVRGRVVAQPVRRGRHRARAGKIQLLLEPGAAEVVRHAAPFGGRQPRRADRRWVGAGFPRIAFVAAQILPRAKLGVVILATGFEEVRMIGDEHRRDAGAPQRPRDRFFPQFDRAPRFPRKVERAAQHVVARRHTRQRADEVVVELHGAARESIQVRRFEFAPAVAAEHVAIEAVEQHHDDVLRHGRHGRDSVRRRALILSRGAF